MIKLESKLLNERGIVAFAFEASTPADLETLDLLNVALRGGNTIYPMETGFSSTNKLVVHVRGLPEELFVEKKK